MLSEKAGFPLESTQLKHGVDEVNHGLAVIPVGLPVPLPLHGVRVIHYLPCGDPVFRIDIPQNWRAGEILRSSEVISRRDAVCNLFGETEHQIKVEVVPVMIFQGFTENVVRNRLAG